eukprot:2505826-Rhodomonas_salina.2
MATSGGEEVKGSSGQPSNPPQFSHETSQPSGESQEGKQAENTEIEIFIQSRYLRLIEEKEKTWEGRLKKGKYAEIKEGHIVTLRAGRKTAR